jgi:hypothetical protein
MFKSGKILPHLPLKVNLKQSGVAAVLKMASSG